MSFQEFAKKNYGNVFDSMSDRCIMLKNMSKLHEQILFMHQTAGNIENNIDNLVPNDSKNPPLPPDFVNFIHDNLRKDPCGDFYGSPLAYCGLWPSNLKSNSGIPRSGLEIDSPSYLKSAWIKFSASYCWYHYLLENGYHI